jgi:hypothetical protein
MTAIGREPLSGLVVKQTTYEGLKTSCRRWHGDLAVIVDQQ